MLGAAALAAPLAWRTQAAAPGMSTQSSAVPAELAAPADPAAEVLVVELAGTAVRTVHPFAEDRDSALAGGALTARAQKVADGVEITVSATSTVRDLCVLADTVDPAASVHRQLVTLLAGESTRLHVRTGAAVAAEAFLGPDVLLSANDLVARARDRAAQAA